MTLVAPNGAIHTLKTRPPRRVQPANSRNNYPSTYQYLARTKARQSPKMRLITRRLACNATTSAVTSGTTKDRTIGTTIGIIRGITGGVTSNTRQLSHDDHSTIPGNYRGADQLPKQQSRHLLRPELPVRRGLMRARGPAWGRSNAGGTMRGIIGCMFVLA